MLRKNKENNHQISLEDFEEIYNSTYNYTLKYIICKCSHIEDVNDLVQETYLEFYKILKRKKIIILNNCQNYILGIAKKRIQKYYGILYKRKNYSTLDIFNNEEVLKEIPYNIDVEATILNKMDAELVWQYIKKKDIRVITIFYLYYYLDFKLCQIADDLNISETNVKNILYRTLKDIKKNVDIGDDINV